MSPYPPSALPARPSLTARLRPSRSWSRRLWLRLQDERGSQITDNLGLIVIGIVAVVAIGGLISGLDNTVFTWVSKQLGLS
jgi:hypothetical protein